MLTRKTARRNLMQPPENLDTPSRRSNHFQYRQRAGWAFECPLSLLGDTMRPIYPTVAMLALSHSISAADKPAEAPIRKMDFNFGDRDRDSTAGKVLAVTKTSILIIPEEKKPPTSYPFHDRLASGTFQKGQVGESRTYRVCDVEVGDIVVLGTFTENKQIFCVDLGIFERPGGLIPPSQVVTKERPWYQWMNAQIAFRYLGIPIPEHLKPRALPPPRKNPHYQRNRTRGITPGCTGGK